MATIMSPPTAAYNRAPSSFLMEIHMRDEEKPTVMLQVDNFHSNDNHSSSSEGDENREMYVEFRHEPLI